MKTTNQKYFNAQKRLVKLLSRKSQPVLREDVYAIKNIGTVPFNCMINLLAHKNYLNQGSSGRSRLKYTWNGTDPSERITKGMQRAMQVDRLKHETRKAQPTSMKEVAIETQQKNNLEQQVAQLKKAVDGMRPLFIDVRDNYEGNFDAINRYKELCQSNTQNITNLWENIHQLERTIEDNDKTQPSLLSRIKFPIQRFWNTKPSFRYFVYYSLAWIAISAAVLTYFNGLSWI